MKDPGFAKFVLLVNGAVPLALLCWDAYRHQLGADPVNFAIHTTGMIALIFLMLSLTVTPVRLYTGWNWLSHFRRMLGNYAFFYAAIHFILYFGFVRFFDVRATAQDVWKRPFILFGMLGLLMMTPLAITSTNGMIKRLGSARWKKLHRLAYAAAVAAVTHYLYFGKIGSGLQIIFPVVLLLLFAYRLLNQRLPFLRKARKPATPSMSMK